MKKKKQIEEKLEEVKETMQDQARGIDHDNSFSYWLGFRRALEWMLESQERREKYKNRDVQAP